MDKIQITEKYYNKSVMNDVSFQLNKDFSWDNPKEIKQP